MNSLLYFFKKLKTQIRRRNSRYADAANGLEYNKINTSQRISKRIYQIDIARTPRIIKSFDEFVNIHTQASKANQMNNMINYMQHKANGRRRI